MKNNIIIFDIDETITRKNLHELVIAEWIRGKLIRKCLVNILNTLTQKIFIRPFNRRFEYLPLVLISEFNIKKIIPNILNNSDMVNFRIIQRIDAYKRRGYKVILITAAPEKISNIFAQFFEVEFISSRMRYGFVTNDLLAKKIKIYESLVDMEYKIGAIYSDSKLDFFIHAKKNILVNSDGIAKPYKT